MDGDNSNDTVITDPSTMLGIKQEQMTMSEHLNLTHEHMSPAPTDIAALANSVQGDDQTSINMSLPNTPMKFKQQSHARTDRFLGLRNNVEDKSRQLSDTWSELYNLLGQYKSELFSVDAGTQSFNGMDSGQLKQELMQRDNVIYEKEGEIAELRSQLEQLQQQIEQLQNHSEQCRLDVDTKDRLIGQYQQDLMDKDSQLITASTKVGRLENRLKMLESRASQPSVSGPVPRKMVKAQPPMRGMPVMSRGRGRGGPMMGSAGRLAQAGVGRFSPAAAARMGPGAQQVRRRPMQQHTPRRAPPPQQMAPQQMAPHPSGPPSRAPPPASQPSAVVCIEVDDDDDQVQDIKPTIPTSSGPPTTPQASPMKLESKDNVHAYLESVNNESDDMKPGFSEHFDVNESLMMQQQDPAQQEQWQQQMEQMMTSPSRGQGVPGGSGGEGTPGSKRVTLWQCEGCSRQFNVKSSLDRHIKLVHLKEKRFECPICHRLVSQKHHFFKHLENVHGFGRAEITSLFNQL